MRLGIPPLDAVGRLSYVFVAGFPFVSMLFQNFNGISPEFHRNVTGSSLEFTGISLEFHQNFVGVSNWSTLNKGITTTRPSRAGRVPFLLGACEWLSARAGEDREVLLLLLLLLSLSLSLLDIICMHLPGNIRYYNCHYCFITFSSITLSV